MHSLRCLFVGLFWLLLNHSTYTVAQRAFTFQDLPPCAKPCGDTAAVAVGCRTKDTACLCSQQSFSTATNQCSEDVCRPDSVALTREVLLEMCSDVTTTSSTTTTTATSISSTSTDQSRTTTTTASTTPSTSTSSTSPMSSTTSITVVAPVTPSSSSPTITQSASSTLVLVQTVVVDEPSSTASSAGRLDLASISMITRGLTLLMFALPLFLLGVAVI